jgi:hypothetical protein
MTDDKPKEYIPITRHMLQKFERLEIAVDRLLEYAVASMQVCAIRPITMS